MTTTTIPKSIKARQEEILEALRIENLEAYFASLPTTPSRASPA